MLLCDRQPNAFTLVDLISDHTDHRVNKIEISRAPSPTPSLSTSPKTNRKPLHFRTRASKRSLALVDEQSMDAESVQDDLDAEQHSREDTSDVASKASTRQPVNEDTSSLNTAPTSTQIDNSQDAATSFSTTTAHQQTLEPSTADHTASDEILIVASIQQDQPAQSTCIPTPLVPEIDARSNATVSDAEADHQPVQHFYH
jgi:hypothetical protein